MAKEWYTLAEVAAYIAHPMFKEEEGTRLEVHKVFGLFQICKLVPVSEEGTYHVQVLGFSERRQGIAMFHCDVLEALADVHGNEVNERAALSPCGDKLKEVDGNCVELDDEHGIGDPEVLQTDGGH